MSLRLTIARSFHAAINGPLPTKGTHYLPGALLRTNVPVDRDALELGTGRLVEAADSGPGWVTLIQHPLSASRTTKGPFRAQYFVPAVAIHLVDAITCPDPEPGSPEAREAGCLCRRDDNRFGRGITTPTGPVFAVRDVCLLHNTPKGT